MERISKLFEKLEKQTKQLNVKINGKNMELKAAEASQEGLSRVWKKLSQYFFNKSFLESFPKSLWQLFLEF